MSDQHVLPSKKQMDFHEWEFGLFIHFGLRTFYEGYVDFDERDMSPLDFNPATLDCEQWIRTAKEAGMKYAVLTAKHHDGFSNWPSQYTSFSVAHAAWKEGHGDVVGEFVAACRKYDIKPGLYYSPYDGSHDFYNQEPRAYDDYFVNQITELLGNYGDIDILWFDGAGSENHTYDWPRIIKTIRNLQPDILIFNMADPDFRWIGNEDGIAPVQSSNIVDTLDVSIYSENRTVLDEKMWLPAECDVQMRDSWFYSHQNEHTVKNVDELVGLYYYSVGRGANLLLNIGPDRQGLLPEPDRRQLLSFGHTITQRFRHPVATLAEWVRDKYMWVCHMAEPQLVDHAIIKEDLRHGENIKQFKLSVETKKTRQWVTIHEGQNIGSKIIVSFPPIKANRVALEVTKHSGDVHICDLDLYYVGTS